MEQHKKDRLNHLAKKSREAELSEEEKSSRRLCGKNTSGNSARIFREFSITPLWNAPTAPERR